MAWPFLTARWQNLCLVTYAVPPRVLEPHLPPGLALDLVDGQAFVSLVAFEFRDTRVLGVPWPGYVNFPELNLRFYVRQGKERGVVFIREYVEQKLIAALARWTYNERYLTAPLVHELRDHGDCVTAECRLLWAGETNVIRVVGRKPAVPDQPGTVDHFFKEHQWGFNVDRLGRTIRYEVRHPAWATYPVIEREVRVNWERVYGPEWKFLDGQEPRAVTFAVGSEVGVYWKKLLAR